VLLDIAPSRDTAPMGAGEIAIAQTDSSGRFTFDHLERVGQNGGRELFAVTARYRGYKRAVQIVDLSFSPRGQVLIELQPESATTPPPDAGKFISAHPPASIKAQEAFTQGRELLLEKHDPKGSIDKLKKVVKLDSNYAPGYLLLGTAYMQLQDWKSAQEAFEKTTKLEPSDATAYLGIGAALNQQQDFNRAQGPLRQSLQLDPNSSQAEYELGRSLWGLHRYEEAEIHARKAVNLNKDFAMAHVLMGNVYWRHKENGSALSEFQEYLRLAPEGIAAEPVRAMIAKIEKESARR
jgi:tetratricopeptide (TPR) repeat protein